MQARNYNLFSPSALIFSSYAELLRLAAKGWGGEVEALSQGLTAAVLGEV